METTIKKIQQYFYDKIVRGEYSVISVSKFNIEILIDNKYSFFIWIANGVDGIRIENSDFAGSFMELPKFNEKYREKIYNDLYPYKKEYYINEYKKEIEKLNQKIKNS